MPKKHCRRQPVAAGTKCTLSREDPPGHTKLLAASVGEMATKEDSDSDQEPRTNDNDHRLDWRWDPSESFSDWTIHVVSTVEVDGDSDCDRAALKTVEKTDTYHVHKSVLGAGARRSEYFRSVFENGTFSESKTGVSRIELHDIAARSFPQLLDHLYSAPNKSAMMFLNTNNATALHYLGQYFQMRRLRWEAKRFWKLDMTIDNCHTYLEHARIFRDDKISAAVSDLCIRLFSSLKTSSRVLDATGNASFWLDILNRGPRTTEFSLHMSLMVAEYCHRNRKEMDDPELFHRITSADYLPKIHSEAAPKLLELERQMVKTPTAGGGAAAGLSCLERRCAAGLAADWEKMDMPHMAKAVSKQSRAFLFELLGKSIGRARSDSSARKRRYTVTAMERDSYKHSFELSQSALARSQKRIKLLNGRWKQAHPLRPGNIPVLDEDLSDDDDDDDSESSLEDSEVTILSSG